MLTVCLSDIYIFISPSDEDKERLGTKHKIMDLSRKTAGVMHLSAVSKMLVNVCSVFALR